MTTTSSTLMKRILSFAAILITAVMAFGIGFSAVYAAPTAKPAATTQDVQPAGNQAQYREMDGTTPSGEEAAAEQETKTEDAGIVGMFGLNWKLFLAQLVNFGIILFVLWKWVFGPVTKGLSQRTEKIEKSLRDADQVTKDRNDFEGWKQDEIAKVRAEASGIITEAKQNAENLKADTLRATTEEQNRLIEQTKVRLEQEKQAMVESAKAELADIVVSATSTILQSKIDPTKDKALIADALKKAGA